MNILLAIVIGLVAFLVIDAVMAQQGDPAKLLPMVQSQRDTANNQVAFCAAQNSDLQDRIKQLEAEVTKLKESK